MKRIEAILPNKKVAQVCKALQALGSSPTLIDCAGLGNERHQVRVGKQQWVTRDSLLRRNIILVIAKDDLVDKVCNVIVDSAHTGATDDGMIVVSEISNVLSIGTRETEDDNSPAQGKRQTNIATFRKR